MGAMESLSFVERQITAYIADFDSSRKYFRRQHFRITIGAAALSALTTVLIGVNNRFESNLPWLIALISSAVLTIVEAYRHFLRPHEMWTQRGDAWMKLCELRDRIAYDKEKYSELDQADVDKYQQRLERIVTDEHERWKSVRVDTPRLAATRER
jgi:hypothetical protein